MTSCAPKSFRTGSSCDRAVRGLRASDRRLERGPARDPVDDAARCVDPCFEFAFELGWKSIQVALRNKGIDAATPRDCLEHAWRLAWIADEDTGLDMLKDRNLTSHTYKEQLAIEVYRRLPAHLDELRRLQQKLATA